MGEYDPRDINAVLSRMEAGQENIAKVLEDNALAQKERWDRLAGWVERQDARAEVQNRRIGALENWRFYVIGIATGAGFLLTKAWEWLNGGGDHKP